MRGPKPPAVALTAEERRGLEALARRHSVGQQVVLRGRIILAAGEGLNNRAIAGRLGLTVNTVRHWRRRWLGLRAIPLAELSVAEPLADAPAPGRRRGSPPTRSAGSSPWACESAGRVVGLPSGYPADPSVRKPESKRLAGRIEPHKGGFDHECRPGGQRDAGQRRV